MSIQKNAFCDRVVCLFLGKTMDAKCLMLKNGLKIPKSLSEYVNRRTDNTMAKRKKDKQRSTKHYTKN